MRASSNYEISSIYNYLYWQHDLSSAGQPEQEELESLAGKGFNWIINIGLLHTDYALEDEAGLLQAMGLRYTHIPVSFERPSMESFTRFVEVMQQSEGYKRFVHCAANYRATVFIAMYLHLYQQHDYEAVMSKVYDIWQPDPVWRAFICRLLDQYTDALV